ncbi:tRNA modification GTPase TrmE [Oceaniovalibus guishaninsula JLT2003]|uniref:tRNA modification GTPase MnmE n=1 Tax=Oceaniovalibus guishaninsula JLT2003 TaxID=1231392 RepID=K2GPV8_9RHOB|nr:tRNA uridine-5-carboxymethylaminomethyl(34) synthesis GTPase MnmE [Oceaniovalibus guishaninsula]EKE44671.1 tRNA modification GTPase TrmE [Oceaniovalibus guishaninsula JLT2003]
MDTIFALATARGKAGVAIVRISGPLARPGLTPFIGPLPPPQTHALRTVRSSDGEVIDRALILAFEAGHSFTGEDVVELHLHGSPAIIGRVLTLLDAIDGFRPAEPGEFTRRALMNDRMTLDQVEGLADLIDAETDLQRQQAQQAFDGVLSTRVAQWRNDLLEAAALIEATIDFVDEDVPVDVMPDVSALIDRTRQSLQDELDGSFAAERLRDGFEVAIVGEPNIGKSSLINALARRQVALTSDLAGTTRDVIEVRMEIAGLPVTLLDTAGLREATDPIERMGVDVARTRADAADLRIFLVESLSEALPFPGLPDDIVVRTKDDAGRLDNSISARTGHGLPALVQKIADRLTYKVSQASLTTRERYRNAYRIALSTLDHCNNLSDHQAEVIALNIRDASDALSELIGPLQPDDVLDIVFSRFCIGK